MSKNRKDFDVTNDEMKEILGSENATAVKTAKPKKNVMSRIWALILAFAPLALICVFPTLIFIAQSGTPHYAIYKEKTLLEAFLAIVKEFAGQNGFAEFYKDVANAPTDFAAYSMFGFLPVLNGAGLFGKIYSVGLYAIPVSAVLTVIFAIVALFSGKAAPKMVRAIAFVNLFVYGSYALAIAGFDKYFIFKTKYLDMIIPVAVIGGTAVLSLLFYLGYSFGKVKKIGGVNLLLMILTTAFAGALVYAYFFDSEMKVRAILAVYSVSEKKSILPFLAEKALYKYIVFALAGLSVFNLFFSAVRLSTKKGFGFDIFRNIVSLLVVGFAIFLAFTQDGFKDLELMDLHIWLIVAAVSALFQIIVCAIAKKSIRKKAKAVKETPVVETPVVEAPVEEPVVEEPAQEETGVYAEAVRYEAPETVFEAPEEETVEEPAAEEEPAVEEPVVEEPAVEEVIAEVVEETPVEEPVVAEKTEDAPIADYDYYNSKSFDPFIASLTNEERKQFTEIFILKYKGETKNLPDYVVGGDNKDFFRKIFIYLGQYREKIPSSLLGKMYNFAARN